MQLEPFEEIHFWAGFPCVDLSSVRAGRQNLAGEGSGLIFEALRILQLVKELLPSIRIRFVFENVASMDTSARDEISALLQTVPYRLDPINQAPMSRPRFCWTDVEVYEVEGVKLTPKEGYIDLEVEGHWPAGPTWLDEQSEETHPGVIYPTCMKAIKRTTPLQRDSRERQSLHGGTGRWTNFDIPPINIKISILFSIGGSIDAAF